MLFLESNVLKIGVMQKRNFEIKFIRCLYSLTEVKKDYFMDASTSVRTNCSSNFVTTYIYLTFVKYYVYTV